MHFVLDGIDARGCPPFLLAQFLQPFFAERMLRYEEIKFSVPKQEDVEEHGRKMKAMVKKYAK